MAITTEAGLIASRAGGRYAQLVKNSMANSAAGQKFSLYRAAGTFPLQPAIPGTTSAACTNATAGAITAPGLTVGGGNSLYCDSIDMQFAVAGRLEIVDRINHQGGLNATLTTLQAVNTPAIPAEYTAAMVRWYLEWYAETGATASNATVAYTRENATNGTAVIAVGGTVRAGRKIGLFSDTASPIASIQSVTLSESTATAGSFGVVGEVVMPIKCGVLGANTSIEYESLMRLVPRANACLAANIICTSTTTGAIDGGMTLMQG
jgi:hypothetical protein